MTSVLQIIITIISIFTCLVAFAPICNMPRGWHNAYFKAKYLSIIIASCAIIFYAWHGYLLFGMLIFSLALFFGVVPRIHWWLRHRGWLYREFIYTHFTAAWLSYFLLIIAVIVYGKFALASAVPKEPVLETEKCHYVWQAGDYSHPVCAYRDDKGNYQLQGKGYIIVRICGVEYTMDIDCSTHPLDTSK